MTEAIEDHRLRRDNAQLLDDVKCGANAEIANDRLTIKALAGDDVVEGSGLSDDAILFTANGGIDDDVLVGGAGNDILNGNEGDDVLVCWPGADTLDGGPGNNTVIQ